MSLALIGHDRYLDHDEPSHPECAARLRAIKSAIAADSELEAALTPIAPWRASDEDLERAHTAAHIGALEAMAGSGGDWADPETYILPDSVEIARLAAGGAMAAVDAVLAGTTRSAFALVRPPGHHATPGEAMGFCLFNNAAVAARFAQAAYGLKRVAILDWDVHHGNGTQDIFISDPDILYISTHGWPLWPGTGHWREMGLGAGAGATLNIPVPHLTGDMGFHRIFEQIISPAIRNFAPELLIISAGYDAHIQDPLGTLAVTTAGYASLAGIVYNLAAEVCGGRLVGVLEGGYNLAALGEGVVVTMKQWLGQRLSVPAPDVSHIPEPDLSLLINALSAHHPLVRAGE